MATLPSRSLTLRDGTVVVLRSVVPGDAQALCDFHCGMNRYTEHSVTQPDEVMADPEKERLRVLEFTQSPVHLYVIGTLGEGPAAEIIGEINFRGHPRRRMSHHGHFGIGIHQAWRGRGIGRAMIEAMLEWAKGHPTIEKVCLGVFATNVRAQKLYLSMGFVEECRREKEFRYGPGQYVDDIQMSLWVKPPTPPRRDLPYDRA